MADIKLQTYVLNGRTVSRIVDQRTMDSDATLDEAITKGHVVGKKTLVKAQTESILASIADRISATGDGRTVDGIFTVNAFPRNRIPSMTDEYVDADVVLRARALKECQRFVRDTDHTVVIVNAATGHTTIESVSTGEKSGEILLGPGASGDIAINGRELSLGDGDTVVWTIPSTGESGTVDSTRVTSEETRITVEAAALAAVANPAHDGKEIVFTVTIMDKPTSKKAVMRYIA